MVGDLEPGLGKRFGESLEAFPRPVVERHLGAEKADRLVARRHDGLGHLAPRPAVRDADHRVDRLAIGVHDLDHRDAGRGEHRAGGLGMLEPGDDDPRRAPGEHLVEHPLLALRAVVGDADHGLQRRLVEHLGNAGQHLGEHHVAERRDDHRDEIDPVGGEAAGDLVRDVAEPPRSLGHPGAGRLAHLAAAAENPTHRHLADARRLRDIAEGERTTCGVHGASVTGLRHL